MVQQIHSGTAGRPATSGRPTVATDFGTIHHHKPTKAVIGVAIMIVLGFVFYEVGGKTPRLHSSSASAVQRTFASSDH